MWFGVVLSKQRKTIAYYLIYISQPFHNIFKAFFICDVIHKHNAHCTAVVRGGDCVKSLLSGYIIRGENQIKCPVLIQ